MKKAQWTLVVLAFLVSLCGVSFADVISGKVVKAEQGKLVVSQTDETGATKDVELNVGPEAALKGVLSLEELAAGTEVQVSASQNDSGEWVADEISTAEAAQAGAQTEPAAEVPAAPAEQAAY